jgi:GTP1/Obg family GTP-binding protein
VQIISNAYNANHLFYFSMKGNARLAKQINLYRTINAQIAIKTVKPVTNKEDAQNVTA